MIGHERTTAALALISGALALALLVIALTTGGAQEIFEINQPAADYAAKLAANAKPLRLCLGIDFVFVILYAALFISLRSTLHGWRDGARVPRAFEPQIEPALTLATAALIVTAVLDLYEDAHILSLLSLAEQGLPIPQADIAFQMLESQLKFAVSYFALFLLSFVLPNDTALERALVFTLRWLQLPVGAAIFVAVPPFAEILSLSRALFFVLALWALAWIVKARACDPIAQ